MSTTCAGCGCALPEGYLPCNGNNKHQESRTDGAGSLSGTCVEQAEKGAEELWLEATRLLNSINEIRAKPYFNAVAMWDIVMGQNAALMCQLKANALRLQRIEDKLGIDVTKEVSSFQRSRYWNEEVSSQTAWANPLLPRAPDGYINNCALANGHEESECQMCQNACPDHERFAMERVK